MRPLIGDVRLHVSVLGEEWVEGARRPVIVAVHGGPGVDAGTLRALMAPAVEYAQVILANQRGQEHSDYSEPPRWNLDTWADDLAALVHQLGLEQPVVLGTSFGGFVVQHYLARHPEQPAGAVLIGTSAREADPATMVERFRSGVQAGRPRQPLARGTGHSTATSHQPRSPPSPPPLSSAAAHRAPGWWRFGATTRPTAGNRPKTATTLALRCKCATRY